MVFFHDESRPPIGCPQSTPCAEPSSSFRRTERKARGACAKRPPRSGCAIGSCYRRTERSVSLRSSHPVCSTGYQLHVGNRSQASAHEQASPNGYRRAWRLSTDGLSYAPHHRRNTDESHWQRAATRAPCWSSPVRPNHPSVSRLPKSEMDTTARAEVLELHRAMARWRAAAALRSAHRSVGSRCCEWHSARHARCAGVESRPRGARGPACSAHPCPVRVALAGAACESNASGCAPAPQ
jgi:hypothetical protein